jgi:hypothetical protein
MFWATAVVLLPLYFSVHFSGGFCVSPGFGPRYVVLMGCRFSFIFAASFLAA